MNRILAIFVAALAFEPLAVAEDYYVTKTADTADGSCTQEDCSLREAVISANATPAADTIHLPPASARFRSLERRRTIQRREISTSRAS